MRRTVVASLIVLLVLSAGCSSLTDDPNAQETTSTVLEGTATPDSSGATTTTETATATASPTTVATKTATKTPTATPTPTETSTPTRTKTATQTATPTETPAATPTQSSTQTDRSRPDDMYNLTIVAANDGESHYRVYVDQVRMELGPEADRENARYPDVIYNDDPYYIQGYIGDGGVDSYYTGRYGGYSPGEIPHYSFMNNGNTTLYIYVNGNQIRTVAPGEGVEEDFGPSAPPKGNNTITVEAAGDGASNYSLWSKSESYNTIYVEYGANPYQTAKYPDFSNRYPDDEIPGAAGFVADGGADSYSSDHKLTKVTNNGTATLKIYQNDELWATLQPGEEVSKGNQ
jgi:hypothetical protein